MAGRSCLVPPEAGSETDGGVHSAGGGAADLQEAGAALREGVLLEGAALERGGGLL